jgi:hypothetical protein
MNMTTARALTFAGFFALSAHLYALPNIWRMFFN